MYIIYRKDKVLLGYFGYQQEGKYGCMVFVEV